MAGLGIERYGVQGGDWGGIVSPYMALQAPDNVIGLHLNMCSTPSTDDPDEALAQGVMPGRTCISREYYREQRGYAVIQSLKPDQLAYALNDSPLGLAAWIVQCFYLWGDLADGELRSRFSLHELITNIMIYWVTESMPAAVRLYRESLRAGTFGPPQGYVATPTGVALFRDIPRPKRAWAERVYDIRRWTEMPAGGPGRGHPRVLRRTARLTGKRMRAFVGAAAARVSCRDRRARRGTRAWCPWSSQPARPTRRHRLAIPRDPQTGRGETRATVVSEHRGVPQASRRTMEIAP
jgi:pimeloyl-ACP methyl ester carboxylesterase